LVPEPAELLRAALEKVVFFEWRVSELSAELAAAQTRCGNLEKARAEQDSELMACIRFPAFDLLHSDTRYAGFMRKLDLPQ